MCIRTSVILADAAPIVELVVRLDKEYRVAADI